MEPALAAWLLAWEFLEKGCAVHLYDPAGIGGGASGVSAGLLHPFAGRHSKLNWMGREGVAATQGLLEIASQSLGESVAQPTGMLRIALTDEMEADFKQAAALYEDIVWLSIEECQARVPGLSNRPGIWIRSTLTVRSPLYLKGLWLSCHQRGASLIQKPYLPWRASKPMI